MLTAESLLRSETGLGRMHSTKLFSSSLILGTLKQTRMSTWKTIKNLCGISSYSAINACVRSLKLKCMLLWSQESLTLHGRSVKSVTMLLKRNLDSKWLILSTLLYTKGILIVVHRVLKKTKARVRMKKYKSKPWLELTFSSGLMN